MAGHSTLLPVSHRLSWLAVASLVSPVVPLVVSRRSRLLSRPVTRTVQRVRLGPAKCSQGERKVHWAWSVVQWRTYELLC